MAHRRGPLFKRIDAPYNKHLAKKPVDTRRPKSHEGYSFTMALVDAFDSKVISIKVVALTNKFSNKLMDAVVAQPHILRYDEMLGMKYSKYPSSKDMYLASLR